MQFPNRRLAFASTSCLAALLAGCNSGHPSSPVPPPPPPPSNRAPSLVTNALPATEDTAASVQLVGTDPDGNAMTYVLATNAQHGTATVTTGGVLTYTPAPNYAGADTIGVSVRDGAGGESTGTITVTVAPVDDAPMVGTTQLSVNEDGTLSTQLAGSDPENDAYTWQYLPSAAHGTVTLAADGTLTYVPDPNYNRSDQIRVRLVELSALASPDSTIVITVAAVNDVPQAHDDDLRVAVTGGQDIVLPVDTNDSDVDADALTPVVLTQPRGGIVSVDATTRQLKFAPENGFVGPIDFTYRMTDGSAASAPAHVRAVIGDFENLIFLSDYTTPGRAEVHVFDGLDVQRVSDDLPAGGTLSTFSVSADLSTLVYIVQSSDVDRVYAKRLDGSAPAKLVFTSVAKTPPDDRTVSTLINADGSYVVVNDPWMGGTAKRFFVVNTATGASTRLAANMPGIVDVVFAQLLPAEPTLLMVQAQTSGTVPPTNGSMATTSFFGSASDARTLTQIGANYPADHGGDGAGFYAGNDGRYIYHLEYRYDTSNFWANMLAYDRVSHTNGPVVRTAAPPDLGLNLVVTPNRVQTRLCFNMYEPTTTVQFGPNKVYVLNTADPSSAVPITPVINRMSQFFPCQFASDQHTVIYRTSDPPQYFNKAWYVDSQNPGAPTPIAPPAEAASEQVAWQVADGAMLVAAAYFDNDGVFGVTSGEIGRYWTVPLGAGTPFLFSDNVVWPPVGTSSFFDSNEDGSFVSYGRPQPGHAKLELMSTRCLNLSIPVNKGTETVGVLKARWLHRTALPIQ